MRLWHQILIPHLPRQQLLGQHRECCALRGKGWGKKHATVDYVFAHPYEWLVAYHYVIMFEMLNRGYEIDTRWIDARYRGKQLGIEYNLRIDLTEVSKKVRHYADVTNQIYPEHNDNYLQECLLNLHNKGIDIVIGR